MIKKAITPPRYLGTVAKIFFNQTVKRHPHIEDREGLAMLATEYETYRALCLELENYTGQTNTFLLDGKIHPALPASKQALAAYERLSKRLGIYQGAAPAVEAPDLSLDLEDDEESSD